MGVCSSVKKSYKRIQRQSWLKLLISASSGPALERGQQQQSVNKVVENWGAATSIPVKNLHISDILTKFKCHSFYQVAHTLFSSSSCLMSPDTRSLDFLPQVSHASIGVAIPTATTHKQYQFTGLVVLNILPKRLNGNPCLTTTATMELLKATLVHTHANYP